MYSPLQFVEASKRRTPLGYTPRFNLWRHPRGVHRWGILPVCCGQISYDRNYIDLARYRHSPTSSSAMGAGLQHYTLRFQTTNEEEKFKVQHQCSHSSRVWVKYQGHSRLRVDCKEYLGRCGKYSFQCLDYDTVLFEPCKNKSILPGVKNFNQ